MLYAILNPDLTLREIREYAEPPVAKAGRVLPVVTDREPAFDPATQQLVLGTPVVEDKQVRLPWRIVALSTDELKRLAVEEQRPAVLALADELAASTGDNAARLARCEQALAWLLRRQDAQVFGR